MNYITLLVFMGSLSFFFCLQAGYWVWKSRVDRKVALLDQRLGSTDDDGEMGGLLREEVEGDWSIKLAQMMRAAGETGEVSIFFQKMLIYGIIGFLIGILISWNVVFSLLFAFIGAVLPYQRLVSKRDKRIDQIEQQLPEALELMIISLRAGQSLEQTVALNARELPAPIGEEFSQISEEVRLGISMDEAMKAMTTRLVGARTIRSFVVSVLVLRQTGGNLIEVLESIIDTMRMQVRYEHKLKSMTSESRANARILGALPPMFVLLSMLINPDYINEVGSSGLGRFMMLIAFILYVVGFLWIKRLVNPSKQ